MTQQNTIILTSALISSATAIIISYWPHISSWFASRRSSNASDKNIVKATRQVKNENFEAFLEGYLLENRGRRDGKGNAEKSTPAPARLIASQKQTTHTIRLLPNELIMDTLRRHLDPARSYWVISVVGSVKSLILRMANDKEGMWVFEEQEMAPGTLRTFEVCSFSGSISQGHAPHLHGTFSDAKGRCVGGHFVEAVVHTTMELCLIENDDVYMHRDQDSETGFDELVVEQRD